MPQQQIGASSPPADGPLVQHGRSLAPGLPAPLREAARRPRPHGRAGTRRPGRATRSGSSSSHQALLGGQRNRQDLAPAVGHPAGVVEAVGRLEGLDAPPLSEAIALPEPRTVSCMHGFGRHGGSSSAGSRPRRSTGRRHAGACARCGSAAACSAAAGCRAAHRRARGSRPSRRRPRAPHRPGLVLAAAPAPPGPCAARPRRRALLAQAGAGQIEVARLEHGRGSAARPGTARSAAGTGQFFSHARPARGGAPACPQRAREAARQRLGE